MMASVTISLAGSGGVLLDAAGVEFSDSVQERIWTCAGALRLEEMVLEAIPGMNNLLVTYDPFHKNASDVAAWLLERWNSTPAQESEGKVVEIPVFYGGETGEDLLEAAKQLDMSASELAERHAAGNYRVAAVGAMPGFPYLSGLDPRLHIHRRSSPRAKVAEGSVIIGGAQTGIMSTTAPSGWHIIGVTDVSLFDAYRTPTSLLNPGDRVRFVVQGILP